MEQAARAAEKPFLALERAFPVAPEKVWRAWTDPEAIKRWFGPGGFEPVAVAELDVHPGGRFRICFGGKDGNEHEVTGVYREVVPPGEKKPGRLVFTWTWPRTTPERESVVTIVFHRTAQGTQLDFRHAELYDETVRDNHRRGWTGTLDKLAQVVPTL